MNLSSRLLWLTLIFFNLLAMYKTERLLIHALESAVITIAIFALTDRRMNP